ncbi:hypothetical protein H6P81_011867 [Aristolochia fimbriata]|uniref:Uncharacterized protein n=1 Tax=Aristolochia fimbriata TaxID=158543 RepID=A0AAV7EAT2_ARIFI|nr:hypothetical protein H6P81_011867 [Aristolochia fimbriata]
MRVLGETWCFCSGGGRSEKIKGSIFCSKGTAMVRVGGGTGFLIHRNLLLTTHANLPSVSAAETADIHLRDFGAARLVPHRFFITSSVLDLTIVGFDALDGDLTSQPHQPHYLKTCSNPSLDLGSVVYILGHTAKQELTVGDAKVVIATDNLIKLSTDGVTWSAGSAGFDAQGNLAFMVCDPMKLASSPTVKSSSASSSSSSSWKKDTQMQFGIPIPIICDWLSQHWEGSLDELSKPKLPLMRLMSSGQKSEFSSASFTQRRVFKPTEGENEDNTSSQRMSRHKSLSAHGEEGNHPITDLRSSHEQGIPTPEIFESPRLTACPIQRKENNQAAPLLDINFPARVPKAIVLPLPIRQLLPSSDENVVEKPGPSNPFRDNPVERASPSNPVKDPVRVPSESSSVEHSEVQSSSPVDVSQGNGLHHDYSSDGETMYSAETMESRNCPSPKEAKFYQVGRSQSCVNYNRWGPSHRNYAARRSALEKQRSLIQERKVYSQPGASQRSRSHDYFSPTVSSIMKKRNNSEQNLPRPPRANTAAQLSPRWNF